jgi:hypothetical protein
MTYTLTADPNIIVRDEDGVPSFIPTDPDNMDYVAFLAWKDEGNEPTPTTPPATTLPEVVPVEDRVADLETRVDALESSSG